MANENIQIIRRGWGKKRKQRKVMEFSSQFFFDLSDRYGSDKHDLLHFASFLKAKAIHPKLLPVTVYNKEKIDNDSTKHLADLIAESGFMDALLEIEAQQILGLGTVPALILDINPFNHKPFVFVDKDPWWIMEYDVVTEARVQINVKTSKAGSFKFIKHYKLEDNSITNIDFEGPDGQMNIDDFNNKTGRSINIIEDNKFGFIPVFPIWTSKETDGFNKFALTALNWLDTYEMEWLMINYDTEFKKDVYFKINQMMDNPQTSADLMEEVSSGFITETAKGMIKKNRGTSPQVPFNVFNPNLSKEERRTNINFIVDNFLTRIGIKGSLSADGIVQKTVFEVLTAKNVEVLDQNTLKMIREPQLKKFFAAVIELDRINHKYPTLVDLDINVKVSPHTVQDERVKWDLNTKKFNLGVINMIDLIQEDGYGTKTAANEKLLENQMVQKQLLNSADPITTKTKIVEPAGSGLPAESREDRNSAENDGED